MQVNWKQEICSNQIHMTLIHSKNLGSNLFKNLDSNVWETYSDMNSLYTGFRTL